MRRGRAASGGVSSRDRKTLPSMESVQPLPSVRPARTAEPDRVSGVLLLEFVDPVSPELVLVDPELAERACALLPDGPGIRIAGQRETIELIPLSVPAIQARRRIRPAPAIVSLIAGIAVLAGIGWFASDAVLDGQSAVQTSPSAAAPTISSPPPSAPPAAPTVARPLAATPRFVWPAEPRAAGYRVALFMEGRQIFEQDVTAMALQLPRSWTYEGRPYGLTKGTYRWVVWPLFGSGSKARQGPAIVSALYTV